MSRGWPCLQQGDAAAWASRPPAAGAELGHAAGVSSHGSTSPPLNTPKTQEKSSTGSPERCPRAGRAHAGASSGAEAALACRFMCWCTSAFHNRGLEGKSQELLLQAFVRNHVHSDTRSGALGFEAVMVSCRFCPWAVLRPPCSAPNPQVSAPKSKNMSSALPSVSSGGDTTDCSTQQHCQQSPEGSRIPWKLRQLIRIRRWQGGCRATQPYPKCLYMGTASLPPHVPEKPVGAEPPCR